jgi:hypothetical protein
MPGITNIAPDPLAVVRDSFTHYFLPALFTFALISFLWGAFQYYVPGKHDEELKEQGKALMLYGFLAFMLMVAFWGIGHILAEAYTAPAP